MKIERTRDMGLVYSILSHPKIFPFIHEDGISEPAPLDHDALHWMLISDDEPAGVFLVHARGALCFEVHTCLLPRIWGKDSMAASALLLRYVFTVMGAKKLVTNVPANNRHALRFAKANQMQIEGVNRASFLRNGEMEDQIMLGITQKEWTSCQQLQC